MQSEEMHVQDTPNMVEWNTYSFSGAVFNQKSKFICHEK